MKRFFILAVVFLFALYSGAALAADDALIGEIQSEVSVAKSKSDANAAEIQSLKGGLPAEVVARIDADAALQDQINALNTSVSIFTDTLSAEQAARIAADNVEAAARIAADADLATRLALVETFESRIAALETSNSALQIQLTTALDLIAELQSSVLAFDPDGELGQLVNYVSVVDSPLNGLAGPHVIFHDVNVHVQNGLNSTETTNGLGNLIVGYNDDSYRQPEIIPYRDGSHNLVIGDSHQYPSYGGFIAGKHNAIWSPSSSVSGGIYNSTNGDYSSVTGGEENSAVGNMATVLGGIQNFASGDHSSIAGGEVNEASGNVATVSGGIGNIATGHRSSISGGQSITLANDIDWAAGGITSTNAGLEISSPGNVDISAGTTLDITSAAPMKIQSSLTLDLKGVLIKLNGGGRPASGVGHLVAPHPEFAPAPISQGSPTVFLP